jgi:DNA-directed RNA polymerase III subunit RPC3
LEQLERKKGLVEKRERTDVRENQSLLSRRDKEEGADLDWKMEALATAEMRIDKQLFVLREFDPDPEI